MTAKRLAFLLAAVGTIIALRRGFVPALTRFTGTWVGGVEAGAKRSVPR